MKDRDPRIGRRRASGFTLLEVMIAVGLLGLMMVAIYSSWSTVMRAARIGNEAAAQAHRRRMTFDVLETALFGTQMFSANSRYHGFVGEGGSDFSRLSFVAHVPEDFPGSGFYGQHRVRRITFQVEDHETAENQLVMYQRPLLMVEDAMHQRIPIPLVRNLSHFQLTYWDSRNGEWASEWTLTNQLPDRCRAEIGLRPSAEKDAGEVKVYSRVMPIPARAVPRGWHVPQVPFLNQGNTNEGTSNPGSTFPRPPNRNDSSLNGRGSSGRPSPSLRHDRSGDRLRSRSIGIR